MVGAAGLEPATSTLSGWLSNQLIYAPIFVEQVGYAPTPLDFQSSASTKLASIPYYSGKRRIRTSEAEAPDLQSGPFDHSGIFPFVPTMLFYNLPRERDNLLDLR